MYNILQNKLINNFLKPYKIMHKTFMYNILQNKFIIITFYIIFLHFLCNFIDNLS
jgi:hypothetical protein